MISVLGHALSAYSVFMAVALLLFLAVWWRVSAPSSSPVLWVLDNWPLWLIVIVGARLGYVVAHTDYFNEQPAQALFPWLDGLSFHAGLLVGCAALALLPVRWLPHSVWLAPAAERRWCLADGAVLALSAAAFPAWLALFSIGAAWGRSVELHSTPGALVLPDLFGLFAPRYAVQAFAAALSLICTVSLWLLRRSPAYRPGLLLASYAILYLGGQFALDFLRADPVPDWGTLRASQWLDAGAALLGVLWFTIATRRKQIA